MQDQIDQQKKDLREYVDNSIKGLFLAKLQHPDAGKLYN